MTLTNKEQEMFVAKEFVASTEAELDKYLAASAKPAKQAEEVKWRKNPKKDKKPVAKKEAVAKGDPTAKKTRQKHTGADGEVKFVEHRGLYVGFWGGKVVVTKKTEAACHEYIALHCKK